MTYKEVSEACLGSNRSHLRSNTAEREILLWAGITGRKSLMDNTTPRRGIRSHLISMEGPFILFRVFGLKPKPEIGRFPLPENPEPLYFLALETLKTTRSDLAKTGYVKPKNFLHGPAERNHMPPSGIKTLLPKNPKTYLISLQKSEKTKKPTHLGLPPSCPRTNHIGPFTFHFTPIETKFKLVLFLLIEVKLCKKCNLLFSCHPFKIYPKTMSKKLIILSIPIGGLQSQLKNNNNYSRYTQ